MKGMRALTPDEVTLLTNGFRGIHAARNKAMFVLGERSGFRISEILSLKIKDVFVDGKTVDRVYVRRASMKGKKEGRNVYLHRDAAEALSDLIHSLQLVGNLNPDDYIFKSQKGNEPITPTQAWYILNLAAKTVGIAHIGTHSMRKTFAKRIYENLCYDLINTQGALGHKSIVSTREYLAFDQNRIDEAIAK